MFKKLLGKGYKKIKYEELYFKRYLQLFSKIHILSTNF